MLFVLFQTIFAGFIVGVVVDLEGGDAELGGRVGAHLDLNKKQRTPKDKEGKGPSHQREKRRSSLTVLLGGRKEK